MGSGSSRWTILDGASKLTWPKRIMQGQLSTGSSGTVRKTSGSSAGWKKRNSTPPVGPINSLKRLRRSAIGSNSIRPEAPREEHGVRELANRPRRERTEHPVSAAVRSHVRSARSSPMPLRSPTGEGTATRQSPRSERSGIGTTCRRFRTCRNWRTSAALRSTEFEQAIRTRGLCGEREPTCQPRAASRLKAGPSPQGGTLAGRCKGTKLARAIRLPLDRRIDAGIDLRTRYS